MSTRDWLVRSTCRGALLGSFALGACSSGNGEPSAAQVEAMVAREARLGITVSAAAVSGGGAVADAAWLACMPGMAWKYDGGGTFTAPAGNPNSQLAAIRAALVKAGYRDDSQVADKVSVERDGVTFVIGPRYIAGAAPLRWSFSYRSRCLRYSGADRTRVAAIPGRRDIIAGAP